ncbi:uncharacterized protein LOC134262915 [Saccostrea cucullata]|uniref:uncharacterized protein LOC134262915 n=1 Tax=Saccostrea cuccullata TaxID=36930 RepID=UPI002ED35CA2
MFSVVRKLLQDRGISENLAVVIFNSWRKSSQRQYWSYIKRWLQFCDSWKIDSFNPTVNNFLCFLQTLFDQKLSYSAINTARSAVSSLLSLCGKENFGSHTLIKRYLKGVFVKRPTLPKYTCTWDVSIVINYLKTLFPLSELSLKLLSCKTLMLLALLTGQRGQTLHLLTVDDVVVGNDHVEIRYSSLLKTSKPGKHVNNVKFPMYVEKELCIVRTLCDYLERTKFIRQDKKLFISTMKPHKGVSRDTISRWIRDTMEMSGIDISKFCPHSTRAAATSAAHKAGVPIDIIMEKAGWSNASTFRRFYNKPIQTSAQFNESILKSVT